MWHRNTPKWESWHQRCGRPKWRGKDQDKMIKTKTSKWRPKMREDCTVNAAWEDSAANCVHRLALKCFTLFCAFLFFILFFAINQSMFFYFMSVHIEVIWDQQNKKTKTHTHTQRKKLRKNCTSLPTGLWTINFTIELIISVLYKISLTLLQALKSYPFFWNNSVVTGHSSCMCLTDRIFLQTNPS